MSVASAYIAMMNRCYNEKDPWFHRYGGRGIEVCEEWKNSAYQFVMDMKDQPKGMSLDRINNDLGYFKENCRWATPKEQSNNKSNNRIITFQGETKNLSAWADDDRCKVSYINLNGRIQAGWDIERAMTTPIKEVKNRRPLINGKGLGQIIKESGTTIHRNTIEKRLDYGWSIEDALHRPVGEKRREEVDTA